MRVANGLNPTSVVLAECWKGSEPNNSNPLSLFQKCNILYLCLNFASNYLNHLIIFHRWTTWMFKHRWQRGGVAAGTLNRDYWGDNPPPKGRGDVTLWVSSYPLNRLWNGANPCKLLGLAPSSILIESDPNLTSLLSIVVVDAQLLIVYYCISWSGCTAAAILPKQFCSSSFIRVLSDII